MRRGHTSDLSAAQPASRVVSRGVDEQREAGLEAGLGSRNKLTLTVEVVRFTSRAVEMAKAAVGFA